MTENKGIKARAIASELGIDLDDVSHSYDNTYECEGIDYTVLNEDERTEAVTSYIKDSVWAFNSSFLSNMTDIDEDVFKILSEKCEDGNASILSLIEKTCGLESFVEESVNLDGHGHFLSSYDGDELELENDLYAYKQ